MQRDKRYVTLVSEIRYGTVTDVRNAEVVGCRLVGAKRYEDVVIEEEVFEFIHLHRRHTLIDSRLQ